MVCFPVCVFFLNCSTQILIFNVVLIDYLSYVFEWSKFQGRSLHGRETLWGNGLKVDESVRNFRLVKTWDCFFRIPKVTLHVVRVRCGTLNSNQCKEFECIMELLLIRFNVLILGRSGYMWFYASCDKTQTRTPMNAASIIQVGNA